MRRTTSSRQSGFTVIELLIVVAIIMLLAAIGGPNRQTMIETRVRSKASRVRTDHRSLATALEAYHADQKCYPAMRPFTSYPGVAPKKLQEANGVGLSFVEPGWGGLNGLTTPTAYTTALFSDPFAPVKGMPSAYWVPKDGKGWILLSPGPDGVYSLAPAQLETVYDTSVGQPSALLLAGAGPQGAFTYDPTNGIESAGDLWRAKQ